MALEELEGMEETEEKDKKKKEKKEKKKKKKKDKKSSKDKSQDDGADEESVGGKIVIAFVSLIIIVIWLAILAFLIKLDVGGFGSSVLYPLLKDVPYVNLILPEVKETVPDGQAEKYATLDEALKQIKKLELEIQKLQEADGASDEYVKQLEQEVERLKVFEQEQAEFEELKKEFYNEVVFSEEAPDINEYSKFYESIDPANAERLYKQVVKQQQAEEEIADYVKAYSSMKPKNAAAIMEEMTDDLELVAEILDNMDAESRGDILAAMDSKIAASVTKLMEPENR